MIRILIADDHDVLRAGLRRLLADVPDFEVVAEAATGFDAVDRVRDTLIDVAIVDISMPGPSADSTVEAIRTASPRTKVLVLTAHPAEQYGVRLMRAGASGFLNKSEPWAEIVAAVRKAAVGGRFVTPSLAEALIERVSSTEHRTDLSTRELQVLRMMARGASAPAIGQELGVSPKTVHSYRARLLKKLGVRTNAEVIRYAIEHGHTES